MSEVKLEPCPRPFEGWGPCGNAPFVNHNKAMFSPWSVACTCGCHGPWMPTEAAAIAAWNRRATPPSEGERVRELEKAWADYLRAENHESLSYPIWKAFARGFYAALSPTQEKP